MSPRPTRRRPRSDAPPPPAEALAAELAELDRKNAEELRALKLPIEREPPFVFRPGPR